MRLVHHALSFALPLMMANSDDDFLLLYAGLSWNSAAFRKIAADWLTGVLGVSSAGETFAFAEGADPGVPWLFRLGVASGPVS